MRGPQLQGMIEPRPKNITIGTAGHVDHGKTALVKLFTGCDTDRLKIEKERGMSIELGFAPCTIAGTEVGIVDVPGHEDFIKTMVAGASAIDACILVVAADDGIMPQTREHMDILTSLGVKDGIVALTKIDIVPSETVQKRISQLQSYLADTFLAGAAIIPLSNITGQGLESFYDALRALVDRTQPRPAQGVFRLPVERAFSVKGHGTVVAGVPVSGRADVGDELVLLPQGLKGRIRAIQVYGRDTQIALAGQCAALNVPQWDHREIERGNVVTVGEYFTASQWYLCKIRLLHSRFVLKNASEVRFHTGTSEATANVYLFESDQLDPGSQAIAQVFLHGPIVAGPLDYFIIRSLSPPATIGGGQVIEALQRRLRRTRPEVVADVKARADAVVSPAAFFEYCIRSAGPAGIDQHQLMIRTKTTQKQLEDVLTGLGSECRIIQVAAGRFIHIDTAAELQERLTGSIAAFHKAHPEHIGIKEEQLLTQSGWPKEVFDTVLVQMLKDGKLVRTRDLISLPGHRQSLGRPQAELLEKIEAMFRSNLFNPPDPGHIASQCGIAESQVRWAIGLLTEQGKLANVAQDLWFHQEAIEIARQRLTDYISQHGRLESVKFKYLLDTTRKFAIPLLDYFDKIGLTRREGYTRYLGK
ncbi:MAG: selenocysteine-specific translation elongation factor [Sedimentisphaerales bacterium]|nr:selenocysteine-specific translation elongation factor [Sedimentisphaerales bacterium]